MSLDFSKCPLGGKITPGWEPWIYSRWKKALSWLAARKLCCWKEKTIPEYCLFQWPHFCSHAQVNPTFTFLHISTAPLSLISFASCDFLAHPSPVSFPTFRHPPTCHLFASHVSCRLQPLRPLPKGLCPLFPLCILLHSSLSCPPLWCYLHAKSSWRAEIQSQVPHVLLTCSTHC